MNKLIGIASSRPPRHNPLGCRVLMLKCFGPVAGAVPGPSMNRPPVVTSYNVPGGMCAFRQQPQRDGLYSESLAHSPANEMLVKNGGHGRTSFNTSSITTGAISLIKSNIFYLFGLVRDLLVLRVLTCIDPSAFKYSG